jgi:hypothetical protein
MRACCFPQCDHVYSKANHRFQAIESKPTWQRILGLSTGWLCNIHTSQMRSKFPRDLKTESITLNAAYEDSRTSKMFCVKHSVEDRLRGLYCLQKIVVHPKRELSKPIAVSPPLTVAAAPDDQYAFYCSADFTGTLNPSFRLVGSFHHEQTVPVVDCLVGYANCASSVSNPIQHLKKRVANVRFAYSSRYRTVALVPVRTIEAGDEIVVPYGRQYASFLSNQLSLLHAVDDSPLLTDLQLDAKHKREARRSLLLKNMQKSNQQRITRNTAKI